MADFKALGVAIDPDALAPRPKDEAFIVARDNWKTVKAFLRLETQWRVAGIGAELVWLGLDYGAGFAALGKTFRRRLDDIRIMEHAALDVLNAGES